MSLEHSGVSPEQMASELHMHVNSVHNYVAGRRRPLYATHELWAKVTNVPLQWIRTGEVTEPLTDGQSIPCAGQLVLCLTGS